MSDSGSGSTFNCTTPIAYVSTSFVVVVTSGSISGLGFIISDGISALGVSIDVYGAPDSTSTLICSQTQFTSVITMFYGESLTCVISAMRQRVPVFARNDFFKPSVTQNNGNMSAFDLPHGTVFTFNFTAGFSDMSAGVISDVMCANFVNIRIVSQGIISLDGYTSLMNRTWVIQAPPSIASYVIMFTFNWIDIEPQGQCLWDYLSLYQGFAPDPDQLIARLCAGGVKAAQDQSGTRFAVSTSIWISNSSVATLNFISDKINEQRGFEVVYKFVSSRENIIVPSLPPPQTLRTSMTDSTGSASWLACMSLRIFTRL